MTVNWLSERRGHPRFTKPSPTFGTIEEERMRKAVVTDKAPKPLGPYSQAVIEGDFIFLAGQGCTNPLTGKLELGDVRSETKRTFENIRAVLQAAGSSLDDVTKCNVYLRDINDFAAMNEVYKMFFSAPFPARTTIQAGALPGGIAVEIECVAKKVRKAVRKTSRKKVR
jgi:2-iminobutanoate/2-iminopropanoate deaminase